MVIPVKTGIQYIVRAIPMSIGRRELLDHIFSYYKKLAHPSDALLRLAFVDVVAELVSNVDFRRVNAGGVFVM